MKMLRLSFALAPLALSALVACASPPQAAPVPATPAASVAPATPPVAPLGTREQIADRAVACAAQSPFFGKGVGGSPLRGAKEAQVEPQKSNANLWVVHLPETTATTVPSGLDLYVNGRDGACSMAPMD
jgi:hypothetical protein